MVLTNESDESKTRRLRLVALLSLYDLLPPSFDRAAFLDFNSPPPFDSTTIDNDTLVHSLVAIARRLHISDGEASLGALVGNQLEMARHTGTAGTA
ncbi:hypothetical protein LshimejAT787_0111810 [Lyophyllum shimeji]|uniref:Uncharacterized protein n=1 Tax=Lyophyllum shimeji TaxID=47721 RepID=A0A9P3PE85_LYOSH|nr:hypothetical protein LshimejAT787_0111810 [Lyophyllum shimeji]